MKKLFFFAAAMFAAVTMSASSFTGLDFRDGTLIENYEAGSIFTAADCSNANFVESTSSSGSKYYDVKSADAGNFSLAVGGVTLSFPAQSATTVFKMYTNYISPNGAGRLITIPTASGEKIAVYAKEAMAGVAVEGATVSSVDLVAWGDNKDQCVILTANAPAVVIRSDSGEGTSKKAWKIAAVLPYSETALGDAEAEGAKAVKKMIDGQLVIEKGGKLYNALGAEL